VRSIPDQTLQHMNYRVWTPREWRPTPITLDETVVYGGYPEERRTVPPGVNPKALTVEFVSFLGRPNSCTLELDLRLAARVQQALLPPPEVALGEFRIARAFHPCTDLAGDGVGIVSLPDGALALYLLDVSGHGVGAALLSFTLNHLFSATVGGALILADTAAGVRIVQPAGVAERLNQQFPMDRTRQYFTLIYGVLDTATGRFPYVVAGHPSPVHVPAAGPPAPVPGRGLPIGMIEGAQYEDESLLLEPGDRLYFYTDGAIEALNAHEEDFGQVRLLSEIARLRHRDLREGLDLIADAVRDWCGGDLRDDVTLLGVERRG
jgi:phosphoserine phosphatase RsbU/P